MLNKESPSLRALLERFIDYAGMFPPANLNRAESVGNYHKYKMGKFNWILRWLVVSADDLEHLPESLHGSLSVLAGEDETRAAAIETKIAMQANRPVYCEISQGEEHHFAKLEELFCFAKIRTGGLIPSAIPSISDVALFINNCAERKLPFKATAGLHHPIRSMQPLTYEKDAPRAMMHGFLNVLMASVFAWHGERELESIIAETDPSAFTFDELAKWRDKSLTIKQIRDARQNFMHAVGSCSFEEPIADLQALGWL